MLSRAYPRSRGGTCCTGGGGVTSEGLSPLTRGNPRLDSRRYLGSGPIPAHAGEPPTHARLPHLITAYPRSRGGTNRIRHEDLSYRGLSPLTRGNPHAEQQARQDRGPIPAHAGEPVTG